MSIKTHNYLLLLTSPRSMAMPPPQVQRLARSPSNLRLSNERSPLLQSSSQTTLCEQPSGEDAAERKALETSSVIWIMASVWIGTAVAGLDGLVMATLAAPIATSFNSLSLMSWLATAFLIGQASTQPLSGKLTDIFSRQWGLVISNCFFGIGNLICGFAGNKWTMILGRIIAGVGGGCLNSISTIIVNDMIPLRQRALWQGLSNIFWGLGNGLGGVFGGYMNDHWGWRTAFIAQTPLTVICLLIICIQFNKIAAVSPPKLDASRSSISRVDFTGSFLLVATQALFLVGITSGGNIVPWSHPLAFIPLPVSVILLCGFVYVEAYVAREPVLPIHFLRNRTILGACLVNLWSLMVLYVLMFYLPIYYRVLGATATQAGHGLIPIGVCLPLGSLIAGFVTSRTGRYRHVLWVAIFSLLLGALANCFITFSTPRWLPVAYLAIVGLAIGAILVVTLVAFTSAVEESEQALVTSLSYVFRSTGSILGVAISSAVYQRVLEDDLRKALTDLGDGVDDVVRKIKNSLEQVNRLPYRLQVEVRDSYMLALKTVFLTTVSFSLLAVISGLLVREFKLHSRLNRNEDEVDAKQKSDYED
ncbi:MAG: hypothetical protein Q9170_005920 [Blastenia crenularia]